MSYFCWLQEDSRSSYLQPPTDIVLQRERLKDSFKRDAGTSLVGSSMDSTMPLVDAVQTSDSDAAAAASHRGTAVPDDGHTSKHAAASSDQEFVATASVSCAQDEP